MSLLRHIEACNSFEPRRFLPLMSGKRQIGRIRLDNANFLRRFPEIFTVEPQQVTLIASGDVSAQSAAFDRVIDALVTERLINKWRNEYYEVLPRWGAAPVLTIDRGSVAFFGMRSHGVHLNGYRKEGGKLRLWIGRRAPNKRVAPGKLDNMVAGGMGNGHGPWATLLKECEEEASIPEALAAQAVAVGAITYCMEVRNGLRDDVLFCYDLELPADFTPHNSDGETVGFDLMDIEEILERVRTTDDFKFNVNLVLIDFAIRHGVITPDDPDYLEIVMGLRRTRD